MKYNKCKKVVLKPVEETLLKRDLLRVVGRDAPLHTVPHVILNRHITNPNVSNFKLRLSLDPSY
jgi:hypothetical protein